MEALQLEFGEVIDSAWIEDVQPAPDAGRLAVIVVVEPGCRDRVEAAVERNRNRLRSGVAEAIVRKRVPELSFLYTERCET